MGLDMYLYKKTYIGANHSHNNITGNVDLTRDNKQIPIKLNRISEIKEMVIYWRKANAIHSWFVRNIQGGEDDCKDYGVSVEQLEELLSIVKEILESRNPDKAVELLPPSKGFFFGSEHIDEWYWEDMEHTCKELAMLLKEENDNKANPEMAKRFVEFSYKSSW